MTANYRPPTPYSQPPPPIAAPPSPPLLPPPPPSPPLLLHRPLGLVPLPAPPPVQDTWQTHRCDTWRWGWGGAPAGGGDGCEVLCHSGGFNNAQDEGGDDAGDGCQPGWAGSRGDDEVSLEVM